jgi:5-methylcytosine-specific restriction endonuclease McrA
MSAIKKPNSFIVFKNTNYETLKTEVLDVNPTLSGIELSQKVSILAGYKWNMLPIKTKTALVNSINRKYKKQLKQSIISELETQTKKVDNPEIKKQSILKTLNNQEKELVVEIQPKKVEIKHKRIAIPKTLRAGVWNKYMSDKVNGKCYVCSKIINAFDFEVGHVVSVSNGGKNNIENLRPICSLCNKSIGTKNLEDFKCSFYSI